MHLVLCRSNAIGSWFIRAMTLGRWSHSAILDTEEGEVYDTSFLHGGCKIWNSTTFFARYKEFRKIELQVEDLSSARIWLNNQLGKPYDWTATLALSGITGVVNLIFGRNWQRDDKWFCSEHTETFITRFSRPRFRTDALSRVTPKHQDMLA